MFHWFKFVFLFFFLFLIKKKKTFFGGFRETINGYEDLTAIGHSNSTWNKINGSIDYTTNNKCLSACDCKQISRFLFLGTELEPITKQTEEKKNKLMNININFLVLYFWWMNMAIQRYVHRIFKIKKKKMFCFQANFFHKIPLIVLSLSWIFRCWSTVMQMTKIQISIRLHKNCNIFNHIFGHR